LYDLIVNGIPELFLFARNVEAASAGLIQVRRRVTVYQGDHRRQARAIRMAKKKSAKGARLKPGPKPVDGGKVAATTIRSTAAWKAWVERLAEFDRSTVADVVDHALVAYAREKGFAEAAPRR
jgi:hypothetical protein